MTAHIPRVALVVGLAWAQAACVAIPLVSPGGRARTTAGAAFGDVHDEAGRADSAISVHAGIAPLSLLPEAREWDFELGYALDAFPEHRPLDAHGGYAAVSFMPQLYRNERERFGIRLITTLDCELLSARNDTVLGFSASVGVDLFGFIAGDGSRGNVLHSAVAGALHGEWSVGLVAQGSYRFVGGEHYGTLGLGISIRWPAGAGVAFLGPLGLIEAAVNTAAPREDGYPRSHRSSLRSNEPSTWNDRTSHPPRGPNLSGQIECSRRGLAVVADTEAEALALCRDCTCRRLP